MPSLCCFLFAYMNKNKMWSNNIVLNYLEFLKVIERHRRKIIFILPFFSIHSRKMYAMWNLKKNRVKLQFIQQNSFCFCQTQKDDSCVSITFYTCIVISWAALPKRHLDTNPTAEIKKSFSLFIPLTILFFLFILREE